MNSTTETYVHNVGEEFVSRNLDKFFVCAVPEKLAECGIVTRNEVFLTSSHVTANKAELATLLSIDGMNPRIQVDIYLLLTRAEGIQLTTVSSSSDLGRRTAGARHRRVGK